MWDLGGRQETPKAVLVGGTFVLFIPIEEQQLVAARGTAYLEYRERTPYRLLRGIW